jgi:hypothetical protein
MQITNVLNGYADATSGRRAEGAERSTQRSADSQSGRGVSGPSNEALRQIMADYDLAHITPTDYSQMLDRLRKGGVIGDEEYGQLAQIRLEMDSEGIASDEAVDLLSFYHQRAQHVSKQLEGQSPDTPGRANLTQSLRGIQHRLDWLEKLAMVHSQPDSIGLDAVA